ncbi:hypothetical protein FB451DRAFT_1062196, partial [Mycena latifolia]
INNILYQIFEPEFVAIGYYTEENAETWLDVDKFMRWLSHRAQKSAATPPASPTTNISQPPRRPRTPPQSLPPSSPLPAMSSSLPRQFSRSNNARTTSSTLRSSSPIAVADSDEEEMPAVPLLPPPKRKRVHSADRKKGKRRKKETTSGSGKEMHEITKQFRIPEIRDITELPHSGPWTIPRTEDGEDFAYRLDMTADPRKWLDSQNELLSMAAIIKSEDQDSWGEGSAGSLTKPTRVTALGGALCQVANHKCQGVYLCSELDMSLLDGHERYEPDDDEMRELFEAEREVDLRETSSVAIRAAAFYTEIHTKKCPHVDATGAQCTGLPVYRKLKEVGSVLVTVRFDSQPDSR